MDAQSRYGRVPTHARERVAAVPPSYLKGFADPSIIKI
jgi:hypothetical protein